MATFGETQPVAEEPQVPDAPAVEQAESPPAAPEPQQDAGFQRVYPDEPETPGYQKRINELIAARKQAEERAVQAEAQRQGLQAYLEQVRQQQPVHQEAPREDTRQDTIRKLKKQAVESGDFEKLDAAEELQRQMQEERIANLVDQRVQYAISQRVEPLQREVAGTVVDRVRNQIPQNLRDVVDEVMPQWNALPPQSRNADTLKYLASAKAIDRMMSGGAIPSGDVVRVQHSPSDLGIASPSSGRRSGSQAQSQALTDEQRRIAEKFGVLADADGVARFASKTGGLSTFGEYVQATTERK